MVIKGDTRSLDYSSYVNRIIITMIATATPAAAMMPVVALHKSTDIQSLSAQESLAFRHLWAFGSPGCKGIILGLYRTVVYWGYIGIMEKNRN